MYSIKRPFFQVLLLASLVLCGGLKPALAQESDAPRTSHAEDRQSNYENAANSVLTTVENQREGKIERISEVTVHFKVDRADVPKNFAEQFKNEIEFLKTHPHSQVTIQAYTDKRAGKRYNLKLSKRRATAVRQALISAGVDPSQTSIEFFGSANPVARGNSLKAFQKNRRATLTVSEVITPVKVPDAVIVDPSVPTVGIPTFPPNFRLIPIELPNPPLVLQTDDFEYGYAFTGGITLSSIHYSPSPVGPEDRHVNRMSVDAGVSGWIGKDGIRYAEGDGYFGVTQGRTFGGGRVSAHVAELGGHSELYVQTKDINTVAFNWVSPLEVGVKKRATSDSALTLQGGLSPFSLVYESRGFDGELGSGMQLVGSGARLQAIYEPHEWNGLKLIADLEPILFWAGGEEHDYMLGPKTSGHRDVASVSPFIHSQLQASIPFPLLGEKWAISSSAQFNWLKYSSTKGPQTATEASVRVGLIYTPH